MAAAERMAAAGAGTSLDRSPHFGNQRLHGHRRRHLSASMAAQPVRDREQLIGNKHCVFVFLSTSALIGGLPRFQPDHQSSMTVVPPLCGGLYPASASSVATDALPERTTQLPIGPLVLYADHPDNQREWRNWQTRRIQVPVSART